MNFVNVYFAQRIKPRKAVFIFIMIELAGCGTLQTTSYLPTNNFLNPKLCFNSFLLKCCCKFLLYDRIIWLLFPDINVIRYHTLISKINKMLQVRNAGSGKSEWNVNETHLIIPMIDGDVISNKERDKILTGAITLNPLEGSDQTMLANGLEHGLVVGPEKNHFETTNYKSDLLIIQNSDLKLLQCNADVKVAHTLSDMEQDKSEILWQNPILKDRISGSEKAIFEVRQVLNYEDMDLEKASQQINLENLSNGKLSQVIKADKEVFTEETMNQEKNITDSSFVMSFNPEIDKSKPICISLNPEVSRTVESVKSVGKKKNFQDDINSDLNNVAPPFKLGEDFEEGAFNETKHMISCGVPLPVTLVDYSKQETDKKDKILARKNEITEDSKVEGNIWNDGINDSFWEKNLPLKKKAKMKRTLVPLSFENQKALLKDDVLAAPEHERAPIRKNTKQITIRPLEKQEAENSDSGPAKKDSKPKKLKLKSLHRNSLIKRIRGDLTKSDSSFGEDEITDAQTKSDEFVVTKFNDIFELVECLLKCQMIGTTVWQTLNSGLKEMNVDILKEMIVKRKEHCSPESSNYSPQLKAFALVLYFKQPAAFHHLSQIYKNGWPSLKVIKEWKRRMNTRRRRNFVRTQSDAEHDKS